jgi:glycerol-3-phosphate dehydrogenase
MRDQPNWVGLVPDVMAISDSRVLVLGSGNFGTCLADHLANLGNSVTMWCRGRDVAASINEKHINSKYLSQFRLSDNLKAVSELTNETFEAVSVVIVAIPTQFSRCLN